MKILSQAEIEKLEGNRNTDFVKEHTISLLGIQV